MSENTSLNIDDFTIEDLKQIFNLKDNFSKDDINNSSKSELEHMKSNGNYLLSIEDNPMIRKIINNQLELVENRLITIK